VVQVDVERSGLADSGFDNVFCFRLLHHLPPDVLPGAVRELCRIARQRLIVSYQDARSIAARRRRLQTKFLGKRPGRFTLYPAELHRLLRAEGYRVVEDLARVPFVHTLRLIVAERVKDPEGGPA
jgi:hypothetical protein